MDRNETGIFGPEGAPKGYALNKMCHSFNKAENRAAFLVDEDAYCASYGLNEEERAAVRSRDRRKLDAAGGNMYFLTKFDRVFTSPAANADAKTTDVAAKQSSAEK